MDDVQKQRADGREVTSSARAAPDQDALYVTVAAEFGPSLARLAAAYEREPSRQQDLLQELHFALWRSLAAFENHCSLRTWVYRVAHNTGVTYLRRQRRSRRLHLVSLEDLDELAHETDVERLVSDADMRQRIRDLIDQLKPIDRDVVLLYLEGLKAAQIGEVVGISPDNAAQKIHRAQKYLKQRLCSGDTHAHTR
jgi:RNA polymerase sigma-70 factor (ECF subfamily)